MTVCCGERSLGTTPTDNSFKWLPFYCQDCHVVGTTERILARSGGYIVNHHRRRGSTSRTLVITFGDRKSKFEPAGFGTRWALDQGYDTIYVGQKIMTQYQLLSRDDFRAAVSPVLADYDRVVCYGASLGAYCAFYFGSAISSDIIAAAPRLSNHPDFLSGSASSVPFHHDRRLEGPADTSRSATIIFDPLVVKDSRFIFRYVEPAYPTANLSMLPGAGHMVLRAMEKSGVLSRVMPRMISGAITHVPKWAARKVAELSRIEGPFNPETKSLELEYQ